MAVHDVLRALCADGPVGVAVDDVQWLDAASVAALAYATRRVRDERVGVLLARRSGLESDLRDELRRSIPDDRFAVVDVCPLDARALHEVVREHLDVTLPRPLLAEVHQASGGNAFYALEIVRTLQRDDVSVEAGQPLPVPESLYELVHARLLALPSESRDFLLAAAAHAHPTLAIAEEVSGIDCTTGLTPALEARIVELDRERIRFTHPLLAAGAYEIADPLRRRDTHRRLAEVLTDPEARAWQLAACVDGADAGVAANLEEAAERARARGAPRPAALLLERAAELTPTGSEADARRRTVAAVYAHHAAGDTNRARSLLEPNLARASPGPDRAALLVALARIQSYDDDLRGASELYRQAIAEAAPGSLVEAYAQEGLGGTLFRLRERLDEAVTVSEEAASTAKGLGAPQLEAETLATKAISEAALGLAEASQTAKAALVLQPACCDRPVLRQPVFATSVVRFWHDDLEGARSAYESMAAAAKELGDDGSLPYILVMLGQIDCVLGRFEDARSETNEGLTIAEQAGQTALAAYGLAVRAVAEALLGQVEQALLSSSRSLDLARRTSGVPAWIFATWAMGHVALARGDAREAVAILGPLVEHHRRERIEEPGALLFVPDAVEAHIECGQFDTALQMLDSYESAARRLERVSALANCSRCRGLLAAHDGRLDDASAAFEAALEWHAKLPLPLDRGRTLMALGATQRRLKQRREARATLEEALALFERIGAALWAERARAELKRISGRAATPGALTPAEERVAALVAEGKTNKEVAAALFLSDRTVEGHLAHVFGKLGIRHRGEVAAALQTQGIALPNTGDSPVSAETPAP